VNLVAQLSSEERARGLITGSTGNHGQSVAFGARQIRPRRFPGLWTGWVPGSDSVQRGASIVTDDRAVPTPGLTKEVRRMASPFIPAAAVITAAVCGAFLAKRLASKRGGVDFAQMIERMPEGSPPRWVFDNVSAIRKDTDRILELLEGKPTSSGAT
jgi:hypothetical protein